MENKLTNIHEAPWLDQTSARGERWRRLDLSGDHLGVRIEELQPGDTSSTHHYHSLEEEHVLVLEGTATLILGSEERPLKAGDHFWFPAGKEEAHHIENRGGASFKFLVFGERCAGDVVVYPGRQTMLIKALGWKSVTYRERTKPEGE